MAIRSCSHGLWRAFVKHARSFFASQQEQRLRDYCHRLKGLFAKTFIIAANIFQVIADEHCLLNNCHAISHCKDQSAKKLHSRDCRVNSRWQQESSSLVQSSRIARCDCVGVWYKQTHATAVELHKGPLFTTLQKCSLSGRGLTFNEFGNKILLRSHIPEVQLELLTAKV
jgi:hypothetical protein